MLFIYFIKSPAGRLKPIQSFVELQLIIDDLLLCWNPCALLSGPVLGLCGSELQAKLKLCFKLSRRFWNVIFIFIFFKWRMLVKLLFVIMHFLGSSLPEFTLQITNTITCLRSFLPTLKFFMFSFTTSMNLLLEKPHNRIKFMSWIRGRKPSLAAIKRPD